MAADVDTSSAFLGVRFVLQVRAACALRSRPLAARGLCGTRDEERAAGPSELQTTVGRACRAPRRAWGPWLGRSPRGGEAPTAAVMLLDSWSAPKVCSAKGSLRAASWCGTCRAGRPTASCSSGSCWTTRTASPRRSCAGACHRSGCFSCRRHAASSPSPLILAALPRHRLRCLAPRAEQQRRVGQTRAVVVPPHVCMHARRRRQMTREEGYGLTVNPAGIHPPPIDDFALQAPLEDVVSRRGGAPSCGACLGRRCCLSAKRPVRRHRRGPSSSRRARRASRTWRRCVTRPRRGCTAGTRAPTSPPTCPR